MYTINAALAISFVIGTALQVSLFVATVLLRKHSQKAIDAAKEMTDRAEEMANEADKTHSGAMLCMKMANELFYCHTSDERANLIINWMPKLQEAGIDIREINDIING